MSVDWVENFRRKKIPATLLMSTLLGMSAIANATTTTEKIYRIIDDLRTENISNRDSLQRIFGVTLQSKFNNSAFAAFEGRDIEIYGVLVDDVTYREPLQRSVSTSGPLLVMSLNSASCARQKEILSVYPMLSPRGPPSPKQAGVDKIQYFAFVTGSSILSLGFATQGETCLREIIYSVQARD